MAIRNIFAKEPKHGDGEPEKGLAKTDPLRPPVEDISSTAIVGPLPMDLWLYEFYGRCKRKRGHTLRRQRVYGSIEPSLSNTRIAIFSQYPFCLFCEGDPTVYPILATVYPASNLLRVPVIGKFVQASCLPKPTCGVSSVGEDGHLLWFGHNVFSYRKTVLRVVSSTSQLEIAPAFESSTVPWLGVAEIEPPFVCFSTGDLFCVAKGPRLMDDLAEKVRLASNGVDAPNDAGAAECLREFVRNTFFGGS